MVFQSLVAEVGGIVGLWVGCSVITLIHLLIFCIYEGALCCMGGRMRVNEARRRAEEEAKIELEKAKAAEVTSKKDDAEETQNGIVMGNL